MNEYNTEFLLYLIETLVSYTHDVSLLHYYLCKCNNYKNKLSASTTCFSLYKSSSGYCKNLITITGKSLIITFT
jgi:hypothetical protein